jgi:RNase adaptor protein for sRNA GlmZ degradation
MRGRGRIVLLLPLILASGSGCVALAVGAAGGAAGTAYVMGKLTEELDVPVRRTHEAVVAAFRDLDLVILENQADKLIAHVAGEFTDGEQVWVDIEALPEEKSKVTIRVGLVGGESRARRILDAMRRHLPLRAQPQARAGAGNRSRRLRPPEGLRPGRGTALSLDSAPPILYR